MGFTITTERTYSSLGVTLSNVYITTKWAFNCRKTSEGKYNVTSSYYGYTTSEYSNKIPLEYGSVNLILDTPPNNPEELIYTEIKSKMGLAEEDYTDDL